MKKKTGLTMAEHRGVADKLYQLDRDISAGLDAFNNYPNRSRGIRILDALIPAANELQLLRARLDTLVVEDVHIPAADVLYAAMDVYLPMQPRPSPPRNEIDRRIHPVNTMEQHTAAGRAMKRARNMLVKLYVKVANAYPQSRSARTLRTIKKIERYIDTARHHAEEQLFKDHPAEATTKVYYGGEQ
jgi:hypothetical protein